MPLGFVGFFALRGGLGFCFGEHEPILFAAKKGESVLEFVAAAHGWVGGPRLEEFLFLLQERKSFDVMVEKIGIGVLVAGEKGFGLLFLEGGCSSPCLGETCFFFELLEGCVLGIENERSDEGKGESEKGEPARKEAAEKFKKHGET